MSIRRRIIDYSRGNNLRHFWRLYRLQKKTGEGFLRDILTFMMSRCAHRHGGYIGPDTVIKGNLTLPHGLHGIFISRYADIGDNCLIGAGAVIIGGVKIGSHVKVGAGAVVNADIPDGCTVVSQAVRMIGEKQENEECGI